MKLERTLGFVLGAALVPTLALADDQPNPNDNPPAPVEQTPAPQPTTTVVTPPAQPQPQQPVVVVNPQPQAPPPTVVNTQNPEGTEVSDSYNAGVFATGALVFAGSYGASAIAAATSNHQGADRLYVPVVGPWLALNDWGSCPIGQAQCDSNTTDKVLLVADGVFQAAGLVTAITGLLVPTHHTVYTRMATNKIKVTPTHNGFAVLGRF